MSKYKPYPKYKESGVAWLGEVPEGWEIKRLKHAVNLMQTGTTPSTNVKEYFNGDINWFNPKDLNNEILIKSHKQITKKAINEGACKLFPKDSVLIVGIGATAGKTAYLLSDNSSFNQQITGFFSKNSNNKYLFYLIKSFSNTFLAIANYTTLAILNNDFFKSFIIVMPSLKEQFQIAHYLDQKTQKIDTLIEKQQTLIKLLKEKRQALISHAVSKGLDDTVEMKDSGVAWLGEVPEDWDVCMFKYKTNKITDGAHISPELKNGKHYFLSVKDITTGKLNFSEALLTSEESYKYLVRTGCKPKENDILFGKDGTIGVTAVVNNKNDFVISSSLLIFRPKKEIYSQFMNYQCNGNYFKEQVNSFVKGAALKRLSIQNVLKIWATFPPLKEQKNIAQYLDQKTKQIDTLISKSTQAIELLKERRSALISAVVTGKVDVRDV